MSYSTQIGTVAEPSVIGFGDNVQRIQGMASRVIELAGHLSVSADKLDGSRPVEVPSPGNKPHEGAAWAERIDFALDELTRCLNMIEDQAYRISRRL